MALSLKEKIQFVEELTSSVTKKVLENVAKVPDEWDGHELRQYISDCFREETTNLMKRSTARHKRYVQQMCQRNL